MHLLKKRKLKSAGTGVGKRICALALALALLLELSGVLHGTRLSPLVTMADAADGFTYQPGTLGAAVLPKDDVFSLAKVQALEAANPSVVLNINSKFSRSSTSNVVGNNPTLGGELKSVAPWEANFQWNAKEDVKIREHLLDQAMDLEVLWTGSYRRTDKGSPSAQVWYYGNEDYLLIYGHSYDTLSIGRGSFVEKQGGEFTAGASGTTKSGATGAVPLSYNRIAEKVQWDVEFDSRGRPRVDSNGDMIWRSRHYTEYYPTVAGEMLRIKPFMGPPNGVGTNGTRFYDFSWQKTVLNVTLSGAAGTSISETRMRLRDNAAPFLNRILLKKNGEVVEGNAYIKAGDELDVVLVFNEDVRFADNDGTNNHNLRLRLNYVDKANGTSDSDSWVEAGLIALEGNTMTFRFDPNNQSGKTLPNEFYVDGIAASGQTGWFSDDAAFPLSLIGAGGNTVVTGSSCCGIVTDLAGNPFEKFNVTRFDGEVKAHYDVLNPYVYKTVIWTSNFSEEEASSGLDPNEIEPEKLYLKAGDQVNLKIIFNETLNSSGYYYWGSGVNLLDAGGSQVTPAATLNVTQNGSPVTLQPSWIGSIDSKSIDVNAAKRNLTVIEYQPLTITDGMVLNGDYFQVVSISDLDKLCDQSLNPVANQSIPQVAHQQRIDTTPPDVTVGTTVDDTLDLDVFTVPIEVTDADSGTRDVWFRLQNYASGWGANNYLWMVDANPAVVRRESDLKTADTSAWTQVRSYSVDYSGANKDSIGWQNVTVPVGATQMYLHVKLLGTDAPLNWGYYLSDVQGESENTFKSMAKTNIQVKATDIKNNTVTVETGAVTHGVGMGSETSITIGGISYVKENNVAKARIPVTVENPMGVQRVVWGVSEDAMVNVEYTGELRKSYSFTYEVETGVTGTITLYVGAYGPTGAATVNSVSHSYDYSAGILSYETVLGDEKAPLYGLPSLSSMSVTENNRTMVLIDRGDGTFFASNRLWTDDTNFFAYNTTAPGYWYVLNGTAASDYSSLTVTSRTSSTPQAVNAWLKSQYGKVTFVLLNQNSYVVNSGENSWGSEPGSYDASNGIAYTVEYAYLANGAVFAATHDVVYSETNNAVPAEVIAGTPAEPHSDLSDYTFRVTLANTSDAGRNVVYGLRLVESAEAELLHSTDGTNYETVRTVELSVGSSTKLCFTKEDGAASGWYRVLYRYTVNGQTTQLTIADGVYLDDTGAIAPDVVSYARSFDLWVRNPLWKYGTYFNVDYSRYAHTSVASDDDIEDGEIVKIGVAPIEVPADKMPNGARFNPTIYHTSDLNNDKDYLDRYYLADNEVNKLTFSFSRTDPAAGTADQTRIGGENHFYAWSGNDPDGRESARANWLTFTPGRELTLTVTDGTSGFDYTGGRLPLTNGYNLVHYVVEYENGETVEKSFMADVRTTAMNLGLDIYYHAANQYITDQMLAEAWAVYGALENEDGSKLYPTQQDYLDSIGAIAQENVVGYDDDGNQIHASYVIVGPRCTDEADLYHRNEAVVNPVLNDYDAAIASSFMSYLHLDGEGYWITKPEMPKSDPMGAETFRKSSEHELFFAEDVYGNVSFAAAEMDAIDGEAPELSFSSSFASFSYGDITRMSAEGLGAGFDFLLDMHDDNALVLSNLTVTFDPAYSKVLDPNLDGEKETVTMRLPLNFEQDELGYFLPWEISESEGGQTGGITMTCLKMNLSDNHDSPKYKSINGVEIQGAFKPCELDSATMTFTLTDNYGNTGTAEITFSPDQYNYYDTEFKLNPENYTLYGGINDNYAWYNIYTEKDADGNVIDRYYPGFNELPDWAPEPVYYIGEWDEWEGKKLGIDYEWTESVRNLLPELDTYGAGTLFTNEGYVKVGVVTPGSISLSYYGEEEVYNYLPYALSVESYQTDYGVYTDGYVRTRTVEKMTGRYDQGSYYQTQQAIILPSVSENGAVTVNWTDVFGEKHADTVNITAFGEGTGSDMTVRANFSPATRTNEDVLVTLKGGRSKEENSATTTCEITGVTVNLHDGTSYNQTDDRVNIYASQPWNATVLMPENGSITVEYRYPGTYWDDDAEESVHCNDETAAERDCYETESRTFCISTIDKTPPTPTVSYVYADTGEAVAGDVTETTREIRAEVTADEPIEGVEGGISRIFSYGTALGDEQTFIVRDRAGNTAEVTAVCPATINTPAPTGENKAPTATVYVSANLGGIATGIGTFTLSEDGEIEIYSAGEETPQTVNLNNEAVASINAAFAGNLATLYTLRFEINDENPAACTVTSSDPAVAEVGANNTVTVRKNGTFTLTVSDNANKFSRLQNIVVNSLDTEAPEVTPIYGLYTAEDGTQRVRVAFKPANDEQIYPIITGEQNSRDIRSTLYNVYDADGTTVLAQRTGFFTDFASNEDYTFYYKDVYGNASSVSVQVRGIDTDAPAFTSIIWNGTVSNLTPDTEGAGPTARDVSAAIKTDKALSSVQMYYYDENAENHAGDALSPEDAAKVRLEFSANLIEVTWTDNLESKLILSAKSASSGLTAYYELPAITVIDKTAPTVTLNGEPKLAEDKSSKEFRFTVSGAAGEVFASNLAVVYTAETVGEEEILTRYAIGVKGTEFIYTAKSSTPVTLRFIDDAGNSAEYTLGAEMLADVDAASLSVSFNTTASEEGATKNLSELKLTGTTVYVYTSKDARVTLIEDPESAAEAGETERPFWNVPAKTWTAVTISAVANIQMLQFDDLNTGKSTYAWLVSDADRVAPAISYTGGDTVFATTEMTPAQIQTLLLSDVHAYDGVDGVIDPATITVSECSATAGLHTVTYSTQDSSGNVATLERTLYVKGKYDPIVQVNGRDTVPLGTVVLNTKQISLTGSCALTGDDSVYLVIRPGVMTAARMKYGTDYGTNSLSYTAPKSGYYTVLARNRDRTEVLVYIYVDESN